MTECEWIKPDCACTDFITYDPASGYTCNECGEKEIRDPNDETKCIPKTCTNQVMGTRNECYTCMDCQKGARANEFGECEKLICDHNKSPFETCDIAVHCACNDKLVRLADDATEEVDNISVFSYVHLDEPDMTPIKYTCEPCPNGTRPSRDGEGCVSVHCSVW